MWVKLGVGCAFGALTGPVLVGAHAGIITNLGLGTCNPAVASTYPHLYNLKNMYMSYSESQIRHEALKELSNSKSGTLTTSELIKKLEQRLAPTGKDAEIADGRSDTYFSQKVRNLVSHRDQGPGLVEMGYASYDPNNESLTITDDGRKSVI